MLASIKPWPKIDYYVSLWITIIMIIFLIMTHSIIYPLVGLIVPLLLLTAIEKHFIPIPFDIYGLKKQYFELMMPKYVFDESEHVAVKRKVVKEYIDKLTHQEVMMCDKINYNTIFSDAIKEKREKIMTEIPIDEDDSKERIKEKYDLVSNHLNKLSTGEILAFDKSDYNKIITKKLLSMTHYIAH